ncbi:MAG: hypothetical protein AAF191_18325, partial [Verrucomicrobiota bacterium]
MPLRLLKIVGVATASSLLLATGLAHGAGLSKYLELFSGQRLFYFWLSLFTVAATGFYLYRQRSFRASPWSYSFAMAGIALLVNGASVLPYYLPASKPTEPTDPGRERNEFRLISFNLLGSLNFAYDDIFRFVETEKPDAIFFIEIRPHWIGKISKNLPDYPYRAQPFAH